MELNNVFANLEAAMDDQENVQLYLEARERQPALAAYPTAHKVLAMFDSSSPDDYRESDPVTRALIAEAQRGNHPLWCSMLQFAFRPMLFALRGRIIKRVLEPSEVDNILVLAFWETVLELPCGPNVDRVCLHLRQETARRVFKYLSEEQQVSSDFNLRDHETIWGLAETYYTPEGEDPLEHQPTCLWPETAPPEAEPLICASDEAAQIAFLKEHAGHVLTPDEMEAVVVKLVRGQRLSTHAGLQTSGEHPADAHRYYQRFRRRHSRGMAKLRKTLRPLLRDREALRLYRDREENDMCLECRSACDQAPHKAHEAHEAHEPRVDFSEAEDLKGIA